MELIFGDYWWPQLWKFVKEFMGCCDVCARAKNPHYHPHGFLQPLLIPSSPWSLISMDFIMDLPQPNSFNSIIVMVDPFTKVVHFIPYNKSITNKKTTKSFLDHVFRYHEPKFASKFWKRFFKLLGVKMKLSLVFHFETNGQIGRVNQVLEQYLRCMTNYHQDNWLDLLFMAKFLITTRCIQQCNKTPFFANHHLHPMFDIQGVNNVMNPIVEDRTMWLTNI